MLATVQRSAAADTPAPEWMHKLVNAPLPEHDEKTDAVLLYSATSVNVFSADRIRIEVHEAYKILRPGGRQYGMPYAIINPQTKLISFQGWSIPAQGKDYKVDKDKAFEMGLNVEGGELITDVKAVRLQIPAPDPGNIVGFEYTLEENPLLLQHTWYFQQEVPTVEAHYLVNLPPGWTCNSTWANYAEVKPVVSGNVWAWSVANIKEIRGEEDMPPVHTVAGRMSVSFDLAREKRIS